MQVQGQMRKLGSHTFAWASERLAFCFCWARAESISDCGMEK